MEIIVQFPDGHRPVSGGRYVDANSEPASVIIFRWCGSSAIQISRRTDWMAAAVLHRAGGAAGARRVRERRARRTHD